MIVEELASENMDAEDSESSGWPSNAAADESEPAVERRISPSWRRRFEELRDFRKQHGHLRFTEKDEPWPGLALWGKQQRISLRKGLLSPMQQDWLDSIGFEWMPPGQAFSDNEENADAVWRAHYASLLRFKAKHGHTEVTESCKDYPKLGHWVQRQRQSFRRGHLRQSCRELLDQVGFAWQSDLTCYRQAWEERCNQMADFIREHGPDALSEGNEPFPKLAEWRDNQRANYRKGKLLPERIARLEALGFTWRALVRYKPNPENEPLWQTRFAELVHFKEKHGHTEVPASSKENPKLGRWVGKQREKFALGRLDPRHLGLLESIGFARKCENIYWSTLWEKNFARMAGFIRQNGNDRVTQSDPAFPGLAHWREQQREKLREGKLLPERKARLDAIGFTWTQPETPVQVPKWEAAWETRFTELLLFKERHGHVEVPKSGKENPHLIQWIQKQRTMFTEGRLRPDRKERLDDIGFAWKGGFLKFKKAWETHFEELAQFKREHGHARVTLALDRLLASWCMTQRHHCRTGKLLPERKARLDAIGFAWVLPSSLRPFPSAANEERWDQMFLQLQSYIARHGHPRVPHLSKEHRALGGWTAHQRQSSKDGTLRADRKEKLDALGFVWRQRQPYTRVYTQPRRGASTSDPTPLMDSITLWEQGFAALQEFHAQHGHTDVPREYPEDPALPAWIRQQSLSHQRGSLLFSQQSRLDQIGFRWDK